MIVCHIFWKLSIGFPIIFWMLAEKVVTPSVERTTEGVSRGQSGPYFFFTLDEISVKALEASSS